MMVYAEQKRDHVVQYTCITHIRAKPGQMAELLRRAEADLLSLNRERPGFVAFTIAQTGSASATAFSFWQTRAQAEQCLQTNETWMHDGARHQIDTIHNYIGDLPFIAVTADLKGYAALAPVARR